MCSLPTDAICPGAGPIYDGRGVHSAIVAENACVVHRLLCAARFASLLTGGKLICAPAVSFVQTYVARWVGSGGVEGSAAHKGSFLAGPGTFGDTGQCREMQDAGIFFIFWP